MGREPSLFFIDFRIIIGVLVAVNFFHVFLLIDWHQIVLLSVFNTPNGKNLLPLLRIVTQQHLDPRPQLRIPKLPNSHGYLFTINFLLLRVDPVGELQPLEFEGYGSNTK
jgi:hypothetical protein